MFSFASSLNKPTEADLPNKWKYSKKKLHETQVALIRNVHSLVNQSINVVDKAKRFKKVMLGNLHCLGPKYKQNKLVSL